jgi:hypothetical protein
MEQVVEVTGQRAEEVVSAEEQVLELSLDMLSKVGGGAIDVRL